MEFFMSFSRVPEESYSRHLDKEVAAQEFPYGSPYEEDFLETQSQIRRTESIDRRGGEDIRRKHGK